MVHIRVGLAPNVSMIAFLKANVKFFAWSYVCMMSSLKGKLVVDISQIDLNRTMSYLIWISKIQISGRKSKL